MERARTGAGEFGELLAQAETEEVEQRVGSMRTFGGGGEEEAGVGQVVVGAREGRSGYVGVEGTGRQTAAVVKWAGGWRGREGEL
jgi:hypothetical protein